MTTVILWLFIVAGTFSEDHLRDMDRFISAVEQAEDSNPDLSPLALVRTHSPCTSWGPPTTPATPTLPCLTLLSLASSTKPSTDCGEERGVILTQDGTTVAIAPMLLGIQVGLKAKLEDTLPLGMFPLTLAKNIGLSFLSLQDFPPAQRLGLDGCWDKSDPLQGVPAVAGAHPSKGELRGPSWAWILPPDAMDLAPSEQPSKLNKVMKGYYNHVLEGQDLGIVSSHIGPKCREIAQALLGTLDNQRQVMETLYLVWRLEDNQWIAKDTGVEKAVRDRMLEFVHRYWGGSQDGGEGIIYPCNYEICPVQLLKQSYHSVMNTIGDRELVSRAGRSRCFFVKDHRRRQVAGSTGMQKVIHRGSKKATVQAGKRLVTSSRRSDHKHSLATTPPLCHALDLVHQHLAKCAVDGGGLQANFTLHGHRQLVDTSCLGDALYSEIRGWEHFGVRNCSVL
uniref:Uncharacterized protein n=1 Tax=Oncorhynchus tshawytscha TaxID=74940 RepID=A0A8C8HRA9_ONCTS